MYVLSADTHFSAAHCLPGYQGNCARMHGHTWQVTVSISAEAVDDLGMCVDFKELSGALDEIVGRFDHRNLNDLEEFRDINPTSENLARIIYEDLAGEFAGAVFKVVSVTVAESVRYRVTYSPA